MFSRIKLHNIGPFRDFETKCGQVCLLVGDNGAGKTTFVEAIKGLLDDHNSDLITVGEDEAEAEFEFADGLSVKQKITKRGSSYDIRLPDGQRVLKQHKAYLKGLVTGIALDPLYLLKCPKDEVVDYLLKHLPVEFGTDEISKATGVEAARVMTLEEFDNLLAAKEADRSQQNKLVEASKGHLTRIERSIPAYDDEGKDWQAEQIRIQTERDSLENADENFCALKEQETLAAKKSVDDAARFAIEEARLEFERKKADILRLQQEQNATIDQDHISATKAFVEANRPKIDALNSQLAVARERASRQIEIKTLKKSVEETRAQFRDESQEATKRQRVVEAMRELRRSKLDQLPIPGIEIKGKELFVDGKIFDGQTNTAEQIKVAFQLAALADRTYPIMVADGGDLLSEKNLAWIVDAARESNFQLVVSKRVESEKSLRVMSYEEYLKARDLAPRS